MKLNEVGKLVLEHAVYRLADKHIEGYIGGSWKYDAAACAWIPKVDTVRVVNPDNWFQDDMSGMAAGLALSALAANRIAWGFHDNGNYEAMRGWNEVFEHIRDYAYNGLSSESACLFARFLD